MEKPASAPDAEQDPTPPDDDDSEATIDHATARRISDEDDLPA